MRYGFLFLFLLSAPAFAQSNNAGLCQYLARHVPSADTEYQPGVNVDGGSVAPADLDGGNKIKIPDKIKIFITPDLFQYLNIPGNSSYYPDAAVGVVEADQRGGLSFNGQPISPEANSNLVAYCEHQNIRPKKNLLSGR